MKISKNWILGTRSLEFELSIALKRGDLSDLIDGFMRNVEIGTTATAGTVDGANELLDFKGRNPQDSLLPGIATPRGDELFRISGVAATSPSASGFDWEPFEVVCYSPFKRFEGTHHIVHGLSTERAGAIPKWLPVRLIGMAAPLKPRFFRYGLEHFSSVLTFACLGYAPQVTSTLLLDCLSDTLAFKVCHEFGRGGEPNPFKAIPIYSRAAEVIEMVTGDRVRDRFSAELATALGA